MYGEIALSTCDWLRRTFGQPVVRTVPIGVGATRDFLREVGEVAGVDVSHVLGEERPGESGLQASRSRMPWYSRSVDSTYLTGKRVFVFGDGTHACAAARIAVEEMGFTLVGLGTYSREMAREVREVGRKYGVESFVSDDYLEVEQRIADAACELVLGTQMERHTAKRLGVPCAVISAPIHVQDMPARYSPQMGWEGANVIFDTWVHPLMMGLEEHLLQMFRGDFEFNDQAAPSHLASVYGKTALPASEAPTVAAAAAAPAPAARATPTRPFVVHGPDADGARPADWDAHDLTSDVADEEADERELVAAAAARGLTPPIAMAAVAAGPAPAAATAPAPAPTRWLPDAEAELRKIPFFVRGKAKRNTERYAAERGVADISVDTLYEAKAHYAR
jgi:light-independent protochlorophyllide reductase subunit B